MYVVRRNNAINKCMSSWRQMDSRAIISERISYYTFQRIKDRKVKFMYFVVHSIYIYFVV